MAREQRKCPGCGRTIVRDDEARSLAHEEPECRWFANLIAAGPPHETREIQPEALGAHLDALARRTRNRS